jgi:hypothetical protein
MQLASSAITDKQQSNTRKTPGKKQHEPTTVAVTVTVAMISFCEAIGHAQNQNQQQGLGMH